MKANPDFSLYHGTSWECYGAIQKSMKLEVAQGTQGQSWRLFQKNMVYFHVGQLGLPTTTGAIRIAARKLDFSRSAGCLIDSGAAALHLADKIGVESVRRVISDLTWTAGKLDAFFGTLSTSGWKRQVRCILRSAGASPLAASKVLRLPPEIRIEGPFPLQEAVFSCWIDDCSTPQSGDRCERGASWRTPPRATALQPTGVIDCTVPPRMLLAPRNLLFGDAATGRFFRLQSPPRGEPGSLAEIPGEEIRALASRGRVTIWDTVE